MKPIPRPALFALTGPLSVAPLIGVTDSLTKSIGFLLVLGSVGLLHIFLMHAIARLLRANLKWLAGAIVAAALVSMAGLVLQACALKLHQTLGIYLPIIGVQCLLVLCPETERHGTARFLLLAGYYCAAFLMLGLFRELLGNGSLLSNAQWLFGSSASGWQIDLLPPASCLHLAVLAPGGFILLGIGLAVARVLRPPRKYDSI